MDEQNVSTVSENNLMGAKKHFTKTTRFWLCLALILILVGSVFAQMINTNFYQTDLIDFSIPTDDGQWVTGTVFKPKTATSSNPAPAVVFVPGFQRTKESHYDIALELARRGMVCFIIDPYNQGDSSASLNTSSSSAEGGAYGAIPLVNYLHDTTNVNYIDRDQISICGHSAGGNSALTAAVHFSNEAGGVFENCKIKAVYVSGYIRNIIDVDIVYNENEEQMFVTPEGEDTTDKFAGTVKLGPDGVDWDGCKCANLCVNLGFGYCEFDEGAWQNVNLTGDITRVDSYESLALLTSGGNHLYLRETGYQTAGEILGQVSDGTMRVGYQENTLHGVQPFDIRSTAHILYFFDYLYELDHGISSNNQIWGWKQFFQLIIMIGLFMFIFPIVQILVDMPFFASIKFNRPVKPRPTTKRSWLTFGVTLLLGALCACFSFVPLADLSKVMFADAAAHKVTWFFPERMNNAIMLWALVNGTFGLILFFGSWWLFGRKNGEKLSDMGLKIGVKNFFKTLLCALLVWLAFYGMVHIVNYLFGVDARYTFVAIRVTNVRYLIYMLMYLPFFFVFYLSNSIRVNLSANTNNDGKGWWAVLNYVLAVLANTLGLIGIFAIQYISIAITGTMYWTTDWLYTNMLWILIPLMAILPIFQKIIYKKTNNVYLGPLVTCMIFITISMCNSVAHGPFFF